MQLKPLKYTKRKRAKTWSALIDFTECPECKNEIIHDEEHCLDYCKKCGLVTRASTPYVAGTKIEYPYSILII